MWLINTHELLKIDIDIYYNFIKMRIRLDDLIYRTISREIKKLGLFDINKYNIR